MFSKWKQLWSVLMILTLVFGARGVIADDLILEFDPDEEYHLDDSVPEPSPQLPSQGLQNSFREGYRQLFQFNEQEIQGLKAVLLPLQQDISSIDSQVQYIGAQMERMRRQEQIVFSKMQGLQQLDEKFHIQNQLFALEMKGLIKKFEKLMVLYYRIRREFVMEDGRVNLAQLFSNTSSPSDFLFQDYLSKKIQSQLVQSMNHISQQQLQLNLLQQELASVRGQFSLYQERLAKSVVVLQQQGEYQQQLLGEKRYEQDFFQKALEEAIEEQKIIDRRIQELAGNVSDREYQDFPQEHFQWPVAPLLGISAHFQDASYRKRFGLDHNAVDIPTDQLTPVQAPLSGKVLKVHDGGQTGYSYVQMAHREGFSTVYGHIYSSKVNEGDVVQQGEVIALSGGAIGTYGAGKLTTGPHLHFEILKDGQHVNPMDYLVKYESLGNFGN